MNELVLSIQSIIDKWVENGEAPAKELHEVLQVNERFPAWIKRMLDYGFQEDTDFFRDFGKSTGGRPATDYTLTIDCAKHIAMVQRSDIGMQVRQGFIDAEKKYQQVKKAFAEIQTLSPEQMLFQSAKILVEHKKIIDKLENDITEIKAITVTRPDYVTIAGYANISGIRGLGEETCKRLGKAATAICMEKGWETGSVPDTRYGRVKSYPKEAVAEAFRKVVSNLPLTTAEK